MTNINKKKIVIYGCGSVGKLLLQIIRDINTAENNYEVIGFLDDDVLKHGQIFCDFPVLGNHEWLKGKSPIGIVIGVAGGKEKKEIYEKLISEYPDIYYPNIIHPKTWISDEVYIGKGCIVYPGAFIDPFVRISDFVLINKSCTIGHDTTIGAYVTISPGVNIGGNNRIGDSTFWGIGSSSIQGLEIGKDSTIGAGTVVIRNIPDNVIVVGNPGKIIRYKNSNKSIC